MSQTDDTLDFSGGEDLFAALDAEEAQVTAATAASPSATATPGEVPDLGSDELPSSEGESKATAEFVPSHADLRLETKKFVLQSLLDKAAAVLPTKDILPVLKNFLIESTPGRVRVIGTDLELSLVSTTDLVDVKRAGTAVFPGKRLLEIVREAEDGEIVVDVRDGVATISVGRTSWTLKLMDGSDYPPLPEVSEVQVHSVDRVKFLGAIQAVKHAAATDSVRPNLQMLSIVSGKMTACDGVRFQQSNLQEGFPLDLNIPINAVDDLVKLLRTTDMGEIGIGDAEFHIVFRVGNDVFIANKLVAQFPDVEELLLRPALQNNDELTVDRQEIIEAIKRVRITADPETSAIVLTLEPTAIRVQSRDKMGNTCTERVDSSWGKSERSVVVNHKLFMDMLSMSDAKTCHFFLGQDTKSRKASILLRDAETGNVGIVAPMRADWVTD